VAARLLVVQRSSELQDATVELVHESLITSWPTLRRWLDEEREDAAFLAQLSVAAKQWEANGRPKWLLWRDEAVAEARLWRSRHRGELSPREQRYLDAVFTLASRSSRLRRGAAIATIIVLSGLVAIAAVALVKIRSAETDAMAQAARADLAAADARAQLSHALAEEKARRQAQGEVEKSKAELLETNTELKQTSAREAEESRREAKARERAQRLAESLREKNAELETRNRELLREGKKIIRELR
jgi:hypothetical protein